MASDFTPLRVAVRIRPSQPHDGPSSPPAPLTVSGDQVRVEDHGTFVVDQVFGPSATQREVYTQCALPLVAPVLEGINACIFAFGCTGAGKTYSMLGSEGGRSSGQLDGILPRAAAELFCRIAQLESDARQMMGGGGFSAYQVRASFLEFYCENVFDLLGGPVSALREPSSSCALREDGTRVYAENAKEVCVTSMDMLLELVARGAKARSTAATGVHAHSSRSHALLILAVEHRWRDAFQTTAEDADTEDESARAFKTQTARLTLVDLAGAESMDSAHGGSVNAAGVATNQGLLVLGRVIKALASTNPGEQRVPFRDSTLTRLMQSCLSGHAVTQMLACVSPVRRDVPLTLKTLAYAQSARHVSLHPKANQVVDDIDTDPMLGDFDDEDQELQRRTIWIETGAEFGDVFARCVGDSKNPLILYVHGSGPSNSSMLWNRCAMDINRLAQQSMSNRQGTSGGGGPESFFHVAIDCPGYGRSPGNRQTIRSYPGAFLAAVIRSLGRRSVASLVGSSQGACAAFNCVLEYPDLIHTIAVCHPVGHSPERYTVISQPALLTFDTEDDGHPVSVGRLMRRYLQHPRYFEFTRSVDGDWECLHMAEELHAMIAENWTKMTKKRSGGRRVTQIPELTRVAGGYRSWNEAHCGEWLPWYGFDPEARHTGSGTVRWNLSEEEEETGRGPQGNHSKSNNIWRAVLDPITNTILYEHLPSGRRSKVRPPGARVLVERLGGGASVELAKTTPCGVMGPRGAPSNYSAISDPRHPVGSSTPKLPALFEDADDEGYLSEDEKKRDADCRMRERQKREAAQQHCDLCGKRLVHFTRVSCCRRAVCGCCIERTIRYTKQCPACGGRTSSKKEVPSDQDDPPAGQDAPFVLQQEYWRALQQQYRRVFLRVVVEYGNLVGPKGAKTSYTTFGKIVKIEGQQKQSCAPTITRVDFNINPGYHKPTASVKEVKNKSMGFTFEYAMGRCYPCVMTIHFDRGLPKLVIRYYVQDNPTARRVILEIAQPPPQRNNREIAFEADVPRNGWIRNFEGPSPHIEYLPDPEEDGEGNWTAHYAQQVPGLPIINVDDH